MQLNNNLIMNKSTQVLAYADDECLLARSAAAVKELFIHLEEAAQEMGLHINESKTFYMSTARDGVRRDLQCGDTSFEGVTSFKYLGSIVTSDNSVEDDIKARIAAGNRVFFSLQTLFRSKYLSTSTKLRMYKTLVRPVVTYGSESWTLTADDERRLMTFERKVLRSIYGPVRLKNGDYRLQMIFEFRDLFKEPDMMAWVSFDLVESGGWVTLHEPTR